MRSLGNGDYGKVGVCVHGGRQEAIVCRTNYNRFCTIKKTKRLWRERAIIIDPAEARTPPALGILKREAIRNTMF